MNEILCGDNLPILKAIPTASVDLIYIDPPFNTGKTQVRHRISTVRDQEGDRTGFGGRRYRTIKMGSTGYIDFFSDYLDFLTPRLEEAHRVLSPNGSLFFHIDAREVHYCKIVLDQLFGRDHFQNEIIWAYDYGARSKQKWSGKHDNILWYTKHSSKFTFNLDAVDRIPYMAPDLVGQEKAARGKTPTDVWWHTIVPTNGAEKTGYATQKPLGIVERIVKVHSNEGDLCLDCFAGSGTLGEAAVKNGREFLLIDSNPEAVRVMEKRLKKYVSPKAIAAEDNQPNGFLKFQEA
ncbi:MAG TPA: site-specific DNA-methyltransferase [Acidobacteriaceae bacterium]|nr:site-specific DNA-methyltransferase [Acidobacteriaceae bacterium]